MDAVAALEGGEAEIRDNEPLRGLGLVAAILVRGGGDAAGLGQHDVDAGLQLADRLQHRKGSDGLVVQFGLGRIERALPDAAALLIGDGLRGHAAELTEELLRAQGRQQATVADAQHLHVDLRRVDRDQRHAGLSGARQDVVAPGETHLGRTVPHVDFVIGRFQQSLAHGGRDARAQHEGVALAMLQPVHADLLPAAGDGGVGGARDGDEGREIGLRG